MNHNKDDKAVLFWKTLLKYVSLKTVFDIFILSCAMLLIKPFGVCQQKFAPFGLVFLFCFYIYIFLNCNSNNFGMDLIHLMHVCQGELEVMFKILCFHNSQMCLDFLCLSTVMMTSVFLFFFHLVFFTTEQFKG